MSNIKTDAVNPLSNVVGSIDPALLRRIAVDAEVDPRTVARILQGVPPRTMSAHRAARALIAAGLLPPQSETKTVNTKEASRG